MQKTLRRVSWTCRRCLNARQRSQSTAAATTGTASNLQPLVSPNDNIHRRDEETLRSIFDRREAWQDFTGPAKASGGLINNRHLTSPRGFQKFAEASLAKCRKLVDRTLAASTTEEYRRLPRDLDRLSDLLCRVIDLSDFIRSIYPDQAFSAAATMSHALMFQYMNELNTTTGLYEQLSKASAIPEVRSQWSAEEQKTAEILMKDFEKSGIDLPRKQREEFVNLSNEISQVGTDFVNQMDHADDHVTLSKTDLQGIDPTLARNLSSWNKARIPVQGPVSNLILSAARNESTRRQLYMADRTASKATLARLEELVLQRARLAKLTGFDSYSHMTLADKMSKTPDAVTKFLVSLNESNRGQLRKELSLLLAVKREGEPDAQSVSPWDHSFLLNQVLNGQRGGPRTSRSRVLEGLNEYFSVGHVMQGLSTLFSKLYGIRFIPRETRIGEVWHPDVRRLDVHTDSNEHVATIYCDLFARPGKLPNPAHFTLVCSREIEEAEIQELQSHGEPLNDGMEVGMGTNLHSGTTSAYQLPVIALVCDFQQNAFSHRGPTTLSSHSLTTLFHEMGHAIHSILGRTSMQGIAGTRCATDFAELPSILMEYFAMDPEVLSLFARHWKTGAPLPRDMVQAMIREKQERGALAAGWDNQTQILMALLDQAYHSPGAVEALRKGHYDSTSVYHKVWNQYSDVKEPAGTSYQGFFGHLHGYGATYYSYLFDRAIARQVWRAVFRDGSDHGAIDRDAGERFKDEVLQWGGGRDPWKCLEGLMGEGKGILAEGGELAMLEVGKWGVGAGAEGAM